MSINPWISGDIGKVVSCGQVIYPKEKKTSLKPFLFLERTLYPSHTSFLSLSLYIYMRLQIHVHTPFPLSQSRAASLKLISSAYFVVFDNPLMVYGFLIVAHLDDVITSYRKWRIYSEISQIDIFWKHLQSRVNNFCFLLIIFFFQMSQLNRISNLELNSKRLANLKSQTVKIWIKITSQKSKLKSN